MPVERLEDRWCAFVWLADAIHSSILAIWLSCGYCIFRLENDTGSSQYPRIMRIISSNRINLVLAFAGSFTLAGGAALADIDTEAKRDTAKPICSDSSLSPPAVQDPNPLTLQPIAPQGTGPLELVTPAPAKLDVSASGSGQPSRQNITDFGFPFRQFSVANEAPVSSVAEGNAYRRNLCEYICEPLRYAASAFDRGEYREALNLIKVLKLDNHRYPIYQPHYVRALCLQKLGRFDEASTEYKTVIEESQDKQLKERASVVLESCKKHEEILSEFLLRFPGRSVLLPPGDYDTNF